MTLGSFSIPKIHYILSARGYLLLYNAASICSNKCVGGWDAPSRQLKLVSKDAEAGTRQVPCYTAVPRVRSKLSLIDSVSVSSMARK